MGKGWAPLRREGRRNIPHAPGAYHKKEKRTLYYGQRERNFSKAPLIDPKRVGKYPIEEERRVCRKHQRWTLRRE